MEAELNKCGENLSCQKTSIVLFGSPLIDITIRVDDFFLQKHNLQPDNTYWIDETNAAIFNEVLGSMQVGGSVTNTARMIRKLTPKNNTVIYFGSIGRDEYGTFIKKKLEGEGLASALTEIDGLNSGKVAVLLCGNARTLITDLGASQKFSLDEKMWTELRKTAYIYFSAFFIGVSFNTITQICETLDSTIVMNLGASFLPQKFPKEITYLYKHSSVVFGNEAEHRAFAEINNVSSKNIAEAVIATNQMFRNESRVVIVTRGSGSVLVVNKCQSEEYEVSSLQQEKIVDTNGAGDAFVGGFLARFYVGDSVANSVQCGIQAAKQMIQTVGFNVDF